MCFFLFVELSNSGQATNKSLLKAMCTDLFKSTLILTQKTQARVCTENREWETKVPLFIGDQKAQKSLERVNVWVNDSNPMGLALTSME